MTEILPNSHEKKALPEVSFDVMSQIALQALRAVEILARQGIETQNSNDRLSRDMVTHPLLNRNGFIEKLNNDSEIVKELRDGNSGIIFLDIRFQKYINDYLSYTHGDMFLGIAADRLMTTQLAANVRTNNENSDEVNPRADDIIVRYGGDEFVVLVRNVSPDELIIVANRLRESFSVVHATNEAIKGNIPIAANVVTAHASHITSDILQMGSPLEILNTMVQLTEEPQSTSKKAQYEQMWQMVVEAQPQFRDQMPPDGREIAALFLQYNCANFVNEAGELLRRMKQQK